MVDPSRAGDDGEDPEAPDAVARAAADDEREEPAETSQQERAADGDPAVQSTAQEPSPAEEAAEIESGTDRAPERDHCTAPDSAAPSAGVQLREARQGRGLSIDDLARTLNLHPRIVDALERDDDAALPAAPFVRGYIRSYARIMGLDPAPLLDDHERRTGGVVVAVVPSPRIEEPAASPGILHERPGTVMAVATLGFVIVVGAVLLLRPEVTRRLATIETPAPRAIGSTDAPPPATSRAPREVREASPIAPGAADARAAPIEGTPETDVAASTPVAGTGPSPARTSLADTDASIPQITAGAEANADGGILRTRTADGRGLRVYAGGEDHLQFAFTEDCWVEVRDADEVSVFQDLVRDGEALEVWGRAPFRIRLGYAPAVELTYNGSRVALRPFTRNDVASLTLGR